MGKFAKVFDLNEEQETQVLVRKEYDDTDDEYKLVATTFIDDVEYTMRGGYHDEEIRDERFDNYTIKHAREFYNAGKTILSIE